MSKTNLWNAFDDVAEHWSPRIVAEANGQMVKLAKIKGEFVWHNHADEDEVFMVMKGACTIQYQDRPDVRLAEGDVHVVPMGVEHCPIAEEECWLLLFEPGATAHTGNVVAAVTKSIDAQRAEPGQS